MQLNPGLDHRSGATERASSAACCGDGGNSNQCRSGRDRASAPSTTLNAYLMTQALAFRRELPATRSSSPSRTHEATAGAWRRLEWFGPSSRERPVEPQDQGALAGRRLDKLLTGARLLAHRPHPLLAGTSVSIVHAHPSAIVEGGGARKRAPVFAADGTSPCASHFLIDVMAPDVDSLYAQNSQ